MTKEQAVAKADLLKPNAYGEDIKREWLKTVDDLIRSELLDRYDLELEAGGLCVPEPYSMLYVYYLCAQVDFFNGEFTRYNNSMAMYNATLAAYSDYVNRSRRVKNSACVKTGVGRQ